MFLLNFRNGGKDLRDNAISVLEALSKIQAICNSSSSEGIKLIGISMGGVIGRYALALAEQNNINHYCSEFISCDSPQRGAVINHDFQKQIFRLSTNDQVTSRTSLFKLMRSSLESVAAKQLLRNSYAEYNTYDSYSTGGESFRKFYCEINPDVISPNISQFEGVLNDDPSHPNNNPGFPYKQNNIKNFAISNGKLEKDGNINNYGTLVEWDVGFTSYDAYSKPYDSQPGSTLGLLNSSLMPYYFTKWILGIYEIDFSAPSYDPVFIPLKSSLYTNTPNNLISDLSYYENIQIPNGQDANTYLSLNSKFDECVIQPSSRFEHAYISQTTVNAILNWLSEAQYNNTGMIDGVLAGNDLSNVKVDTYLNNQLYYHCETDNNGQYHIPYPYINSASVKVVFTKPNCYPADYTFQVNYVDGLLQYNLPTVNFNSIPENAILVDKNPNISAFRTIQAAVDYVSSKCSTTTQKSFTIAVQNNTDWEPFTISELKNANLTIQGAGAYIETNRIISQDIGLQISCNTNCNFIIKNLSFTNNCIAVVIDDDNTYSTFKFDSCIIKDNIDPYCLYSQTYAGAGIHSKLPLTIENCTFENNQANWNVNSNNNYVLSGYGSAVYVEATSGTVNINNNLFKNNKGRGYAVYVNGDVHERPDRSAIINIKGNTFKENSVINGQSSYQYADDYTSVFVSYAEKLVFEKNLICNEKNLNGAYYSSMFNRVKNTHIINNTFADNMVRVFSLYFDTQDGSLKINNNILLNNTVSGGGDELYTLISELSVTHQDIGYNIAYNNKYNNTSLVTPKAGFDNLDPQIYTASDPNPYHPIWTNDIISRCIDKGNPDLNGNGVDWYSDAEDRDLDGSRKDIGAFAAEYHKENKFTYLPAGLKNYINWISFPALNVRTDEMDRFKNVFDGIEARDFTKLYSGHLGETDHYVVSDEGGFYNLIYQIQRPLGYQLTLKSAFTVDISGFDLPENYPITLTRDPNNGIISAPLYNWVGYFLPKPMTAWEAFASVLDKIDEIKAKNWTTIKTNGVWSNYNNPSFTISYGDMVMVHCTQTVTTTLGNGGSSQQASAPRQTAQSFFYIEEEDYIPLFIDLNNESKSQPSEIGLYINGICQGAAVVDDIVVQLNAYVLNDSIDYDSADISFVLHYENKSAPKMIQTYSLFDKIEKKFISRDLDMSTKERFYTVKLNDIPEIEYETALNSNYPNPFNPSTIIAFSLKEDSKVELSIFNVKGQKVSTLSNDYLKKGNHSIVWNGKDNSGRLCSSGVYFYRLKVNNQVFSRKMLMMK